MPTHQLTSPGLYDPRTGSPLQWRNGLPQRHAAAAPQSARSIAIAELRGMTIVSCLVQQTGRLRGEVDEEENSHIREQLTSLVKDLEQLWRKVPPLWRHSAVADHVYRQTRP